MFTVVFEAVSKDPASVALLTGRDNKCRFYPASVAGTYNPTLPYATYQYWADTERTICGPKWDHYTVQVDAWCKEYSEAEQLNKVLRTACERIGEVTRFDGPELDPETKLYRVSFDLNVTQERL